MSQQRETYVSNLKENIGKTRELLDLFALQRDMGQIEEFRRYFHTIRGTAQTLRLKELGSIGACLDLNLAQLVKRKAKAGEFIKALEDGIAAVEQTLAKYDREPDSVLGQAGQPTGNAPEMEADVSEAGTAKANYTDRKVTWSQEKKSEHAPILVMLDDDDTLLELVKRVLEKDGFQVHTALEYNSAEKLLKDIQPDLFLLDLNMKEKDGFEVLRHIREQGISVPVVVCSGDSTTDTKEKALAAGAADTLAKPLKIKEMAATIQTILKKISAEE